jgi:hypothetical protein
LEYSGNGHRAKTAVTGQATLLPTDWTWGSPQCSCDPDRAHSASSRPLSRSRETSPEAGIPGETVEPVSATGVTAPGPVGGVPERSRSAEGVRSTPDHARPRGSSRDVAVVWKFVEILAVVVVMLGLLAVVAYPVVRLTTTMWTPLAAPRTTVAHLTGWSPAVGLRTVRQDGRSAVQGRAWLSPPARSAGVVTGPTTTDCRRRRGEVSTALRPPIVYSRRTPPPTSFSGHPGRGSGRRLARSEGSSPRSTW